MATQVQCPNCGGYRVSSTSTYVDPKTRKKVGSSAPGCIFSILAVLATGGVVTLIFVLTVVNPSLSDISTVPTDAQPALFQQLSSTLVSLDFIIPLVVGLIVYLLFRVKKRQAIAKAITVYHSICSLCGYSWQWDEGHPRPVSQVRPDLMEKGTKGTKIVFWTNRREEADEVVTLTNRREEAQEMHFLTNDRNKAQKVVFVTNRRQEAQKVVMLTNRIE